MSKLIKNELNLLSRNKILLLFISLLFSFTICYLVYRGFYLSSFEEYVTLFVIKGELQKFVFFYFVLISLISLQFFSVDQDNGIIEIVYLYHKNQKNARLFILLVLVFVEAIIVNIFTIFFCIIKCNPLFKKDFIIDLSIFILVIYLSIGFFCILYNYILSDINRKSIRIIAWVVIQFVLGYPSFYVFDLFSLSFTKNGIFNRIIDFLAVLPDGFQYMPLDQYAIYPIQPHQLFIIYFWILLLLLIICIKEFNRKKVWPFLLAFLVIIDLSFCFLPFTLAIPGHKRNDEFTQVKQSPSYNSLVVENESDYSNFEKTFSVTNYRIKLTALLYPYFDVMMDVDDSTLKEYTFTLQKGFNILDVEDQDGRKLDYYRNNDYLSVFSKGETEQIRVRYYGGTGSFCSDVSYIFLKPGIPFYPMPGKLQVYDDSDFYNMNYWEINRLSNNPYIELDVNTFGEVTSSLPQIGKNKFAGNADSFFVLKGQYKVIEYSGVRIIYPYGSESISVIDDERNLSDYMEYYWNNIDQERKTKTILTGYIHGSDSREVEKYYDFSCVNCFGYIEQREKYLMTYIEIEGL